ncbi:MAG: nucleotide exchange factor GrpE [Thermaerobacter sp.]|nr:nucleotide exchange factor GrpE [Thermaerobacter sp.]
MQEEQETTLEGFDAEGRAKDAETATDEGEISVSPDAEGEQQPSEDSQGAAAPNWELLAEERYEQLVRLRADFENFRRRVDRDRDELSGRLTGRLLSDLLPVYDNLERAIKYMPNEGDAKAWRVGVEMTLKGFDEALTRMGVAPIPSVGEIFDPRVHEAVQRVDHEAPEGTIVEELQKGFQWNDQVIRASLVRVSTGNPVASDQ